MRLPARRRAHAAKRRRRSWPGIIRPRVANILGLVRERMEQAGVAAFAGERVVLTGGASGLVGLGEFAANTLGRPVRVSMPQASAGLPQGVCSPAFSTVAGLLAVAAAGGEEVTAYETARRWARDISGASGSGSRPVSVTVKTALAQPPPR